MADKKMHPLSLNDADRIDKLVQQYQVEVEKRGMRKVNRTTILRALIFFGEKIDTEDFIEMIKQAQIYA